MSKTKGHTKSIREHSVGERKMTPYLADKDKGSMKFVVDPARKTGTSKTGKLVTKNANRSKKKAARQQGQKNINEALAEE